MNHEIENDLSRCQLILRELNIVLAEPSSRLKRDALARLHMKVRACLDLIQFHNNKRECV